MHVRTMTLSPGDTASNVVSLTLGILIHLACIKCPTNVGWGSLSKLHAPSACGDL